MKFDRLKRVPVFISAEKLLAGFSAPLREFVGRLPNLTDIATEIFFFRPTAGRSK